MEPVTFIVLVVLIGILFLIRVVSSVKQNKDPGHTKRLLIILVIFSVLLVVPGVLLIAALSMDAWFFSESAIVVGYSPFFLGLIMFIYGVTHLASLRRTR